MAGELYIILILFPAIGIILLIRGIYILKNASSLMNNGWVTPVYAPIRNTDTGDRWYIPRFKFFGLFNVRPVIKEGKFKIGTPEDVFGKEKSLAYLKRLGKIYILVSSFLFIISLVIAFYLLL